MLALRGSAGTRNPDATPSSAVDHQRCGRRCGPPLEAHHALRHLGRPVDQPYAPRHPAGLPTATTLQFVFIASQFRTKFPSIREGQRLRTTQRPSALDSSRSHWRNIVWHRLAKRTPEPPSRLTSQRGRSLRAARHRSPRRTDGRAQRPRASFTPTKLAHVRTESRGWPVAAKHGTDLVVAAIPRTVHAGARRRWRSARRL